MTCGRWLSFFGMSSILWLQLSRVICPVAAFDGHISGERAEVNEASDEDSCEVGACISLSPASSAAPLMFAIIVVETFIESSKASSTDVGVTVDVDVMWKLELYQMVETYVLSAPHQKNRVESLES